MNDSQRPHKLFDETVKDKLTLSPIEKYKKYNRYPYKMVISIALLVLTTLSIFNLLSIYSRTGQSQIAVWKQVADFSENSSGENIILTTSYFQTHIQNIIQNLNIIDQLIYQKVDCSEANFSITAYPKFPIADVELKENIFGLERGFYYDNYSYPFNISVGKCFN